MSKDSFDLSKLRSRSEKRPLPAQFPTLPSLTLSEDEHRLIKQLEQQRRDTWEMQLCDTFYRGEEVIADLGIAIPKEVSDKINCVVGWPRQAVDPYVERLSVDGFRLPDATDVDQDLADLWDANNMHAEESLLFTDVLSIRRGFLFAGSPESKGDPARITVESPLNVTVLWDITGRLARGVLRTYELDGRKSATLMVPGKTVQVAQNDAGQWEVVDRDEYDLDRIPIAQIANNARSNDRGGFSEITPELRSIVASACRSLLGLEVAGQLYSVPRELILGATEKDFQDTNGNVKSAWDTYITALLALERDEDGNLPEVHQLVAYDPSVYTKVVEMYASQAAGILSAPPQDLGLYTDGNPISNESWAASEGRRDRRAVRKQKQYAGGLVSIMQDGLRLMHRGELPAKYRRLAVDWCDVSIETPGVTTDAITKQITAGSIPATSDVTLKRLGYTAVERRQLEKDRESAAQQETEHQIVELLTKGQPAKQAPPAGGTGGAGS